MSISLLTLQDLSPGQLTARNNLLGEDMIKNPKDRAFDQAMLAADKLLGRDEAGISQNPQDLAQLQGLTAKMAKIQEEQPNLPIYSLLGLPDKS